MGGALTEREIQVVRLVVKRMMNKEIAYEMRISEKTVKSHLANIFLKLNLRNRVAVALWYMKAFERV